MDSYLQRLNRDWQSNPSDLATATKLITALWRIHNGEPLSLDPVFIYYTVDCDPGEGMIFSSLEAAQEHHAGYAPDLFCREAGCETQCSCYLTWERGEVNTDTWYCGAAPNYTAILLRDSGAPRDGPSPPYGSGGRFRIKEMQIKA